MPHKWRWRRPLSLTLIVLGGVLMYLAPAIVPGLFVLGFGVLLELAGITLEHRSK